MSANALSKAFATRALLRRHQPGFTSDVTLRAKRLKNDSFETVGDAGAGTTGAGPVVLAAMFSEPGGRGPRRRRESFSPYSRGGAFGSRGGRGGALGSRGGRGAAFGSRGGRAAPDDEPSRRGPRDE